jgi:hypothetical protein
MRLIAPLRPSIDELNSLALHLPERVQENGYLGLFLTAGYQLAPERKIVYPFETPKLTYLGTYLCGKELRIDGSVGDYTGGMMIGGLRVRGSMGSWAGFEMIGMLENEGRCDAFAGWGMIGTLRQGDDCGSFAGEYVSGTHFSPHPLSGPHALSVYLDTSFSIPFSHRTKREGALYLNDDDASTRMKKVFYAPFSLALSNVPCIRPYARRVAQRRYKRFLRAVSDPSAPYTQTYTMLHKKYRWKVRW